LKKIEIYIPENQIKPVIQILHNNQVEGISYYEILGQGKLERSASERIVQGYRTNEMFIPEFVKRIKVEIIILDEKVQSITNSIKNDHSIKGKLVVSDITEDFNL